MWHRVSIALWFSTRVGRLFDADTADMMLFPPHGQAFKLGEDTGGEDDLFITSETYDQIKDLRKFDEIEMEEKEVMKSKVLIPYKAVKWQQLDVATWDRTQDDLAVGTFTKRTVTRDVNAPSARLV